MTATSRRDPNGGSGLDPGPDELYVGYLPQAPPGIARFVRRTVWLLAALLVGAAVLLVVLQAPFDPGVFEFGSPRTLVGRIVEEPYPALVLDAPVLVLDAPTPHSRLLLVDPGKHGADDRVEGLDGATVQVAGTLAARPDLAVLELSPLEIRVLEHGAVQIAEDPPPRPTADGTSDGTTTIAGASAPLAATTGARVTLRGEIVDSKCFAGVMKPGRDRVHRACATRCIAGGIPPAFVAPTAGGGVDVYVLVDAEGAAVGERILPWVGEPIALEGVTETRDDLTFLRADLGSLRRLGRGRQAGAAERDSSR
jgi:hypothetical protein